MGQLLKAPTHEPWAGWRTYHESPVSAEQSFSRLKLIKNCLRRSLSQFCLSLLATISIERIISINLDYDNIISQFARKKGKEEVITTKNIAITSKGIDNINFRQADFKLKYFVFNWKTSSNPTHIF